MGPRLQVKIYVGSRDTFLLPARDSIISHIKLLRSSSNDDCTGDLVRVIQQNNVGNNNSPKSLGQARSSLVKLGQAKSIKLITNTVLYMTKWLVAKTANVLGGKIEHSIKEHPLLHACCAQDHFGDVNIDIRPEVKPDKVCDVTKKLPFPDNSFAAVVADIPWVNKWKWNLGNAMREFLRVAPIVYIISPWLYGAKTCYPAEIKVSWRPGINTPILFIKYIRR